jgi:hypothetical protein
VTSQVPEVQKNADMKDVPKNFAIPPIEMFIPKPSELIEEKPSVQEMNKLVSGYRNYTFPVSWKVCYCIS